VYSRVLFLCAVRYQYGVFENGVLMRMFWVVRDEVIGVFRKPRNEQLPNLYSSPYVIRIMK
jgi:hypothetical protein